MNSRGSRQIMLLIGCIVFGLGVVFAAVDLSARRGQQLAMARKVSDLKALQSIAQVKDRSQSTRQIFEKLPIKRPVVIRDLINHSAGLPVVFDIKESDDDVAGPWSILRNELTVENLTVAQLMALVQTIEVSSGQSLQGQAQRPPWRMRDCTLRAADAKGVVHATIMLEALAQD